VSAGPDAAVEPGLFLVIFEEAPASDQERPEKAAAEDFVEGAGKRATDVNARIAALKQELRAKEKYLQTTNEELETSMKELQSVNEELATVNTELQTKVADLSQAHNDMNNLLAGTSIGTIFLDHQFQIQRFTPAVTQVINLILTDVGRPVGHIHSNLASYDRLVKDVQEVLDSPAPKEVEVQTKAGAWLLLRILPYHTLENVIKGAVRMYGWIEEVWLTATALVNESGETYDIATTERAMESGTTREGQDHDQEKVQPRRSRCFFDGFERLTASRLPSSPRLRQAGSA